VVKNKNFKNMFLSMCDVKERYIAGSSTCSTKELYIHLTNILSAVNKGNNKTTEQYYKGKVKTDKISQQPENCENRNDPDLVQAFLKKWWVESDFKASDLPLYK
jgi:hypothetical protein